MSKFGLIMAQRKVQEALIGLEDVFVKGAKLTFVMRHPDVPEGELIVSSDDLKEVAKLLEKKAEEI